MELQAQFLHYFDLPLQQLRRELDAYHEEGDLWIVTPGIVNSGGNLIVHLLGNLNHYIGHYLGNTGYLRQRPREFSVTGVPREHLRAEIAATQQMLATVLPSLTDLDRPYPSAEASKQGSVRFILFQLLNHLNYHLGQVNYHRRLLARS
ncbi:MAG: DinB family protein [Bacteroidota bacterium]